EEIKPCRKDSIEISQIVLSLGGWKRAESTTMTRWGKQRYYVKDLPYFPILSLTLPFFEAFSGPFVLLFRFCSASISAPNTLYYIYFNRRKDIKRT
ncbi:MAG: hypothetical protein IKE24_06285, partial [Clostridia bacterium]|nr:hypothetical protein [Clostridia bacterium]